MEVGGSELECVGVDGSEWEWMGVGGSGWGGWEHGLV